MTDFTGVAVKETVGVRAARFVSLVAIGLVLALGAAQGGGGNPAGGESSLLPAGVLLFADYSLGGERVPGLYRINANGTSGRPFRGRFYHGGDPDWSPDGRRIAFVRWLDHADDWRSWRFGQDIVVAAANAAAAHVLIAHTDQDLWPGRPEWSPDGRQIAFVKLGGIYITDTKPQPFKTGKPVRGSAGANRISWSPSGDELLVGRDSGVYRLPINGGPARLILRHGHQAVWSSDGRHAAYVSDRGGLYVLDLRNGHSRFVTPASAGGLSEWSPDGHWLAFTDCPPARVGGLQPDCELVIVRPDGSARRTIYTATPMGLGQPSWH